MATNEILNILANAMRNFTYNIVSSRPVAAKEDVKNLIIDLMRACDDDEIEYIQKRLIEED